MGEMTPGVPRRALSQSQLADLRRQVACLGCGAIPEEIRSSRPAGQGYVSAIVVTEHYLGCKVERRERRERYASAYKDRKESA